jgi:hypothetical protein
MCNAIVWQGLERQILSPAARALFNDARSRHAALGAYESLAAAVAVRRNGDDVAADAVLSALIAEHAKRRHPVWAAALAVAMRGPLEALARKIAWCAESDATSIVLLAFLEVAAHDRTETAQRRLGLRIYSETRRRIMRLLARERRHGTERADDDIDSVVPHQVESFDIETAMDQRSIARSLAAQAPMRSESVAQYVARVRTPGKRTRELEPELAHQRRPVLDQVRDAFARIA